MLIKVRVFSNSKNNKIIEKTDNSFEINVKEKPIKGLANKALIGILSSHFDLSISEIRLIKGFRSQNKIFEIKITK